MGLAGRNTRGCPRSEMPITALLQSHSPSRDHLSGVGLGLPVLAPEGGNLGERRAGQRHLQVITEVGRLGENPDGHLVRQGQLALGLFPVGGAQALPRPVKVVQGGFVVAPVVGAHQRMSLGDQLVRALLVREELFERRSHLLCGSCRIGELGEDLRDLGCTHEPSDVRSSDERDRKSSGQLARRDTDLAYLDHRIGTPRLPALPSGVGPAAHT